MISLVPIWYRTASFHMVSPFATVWVSLAADADMVQVQNRNSAVHIETNFFINSSGFGFLREDIAIVTVLLLLIKCK